MARTGTIPPLAVPDPGDKISSQQQGPTRTCTLPSPTLFVPDQPTLIDTTADAHGADRVRRDAGCDHQVTVEVRTASVLVG